MSETELSKGFLSLFQLLQKKKEGDLLGEADICVATGWNAKSLSTYISKNKLSKYLFRIDKEYHVLQDGRDLDAQDFYLNVTQVSPERMPLRRGMQLVGQKDKYILQNEIGKGAVAHVWKAESSDGLIAVKIVDPRADLLQPNVFPNVKKRFEREAKNGMRLALPGLVKYLDVGKIESRPFLVMELAESSAGQLLKRKEIYGALANKIVLFIANALKEIHAAKLVHRDIKPDNILVIGDKFVLGDLGIVKWSDFSNASISAGSITRESIQLGSWNYMAPEQKKAPHEATPESDLYALGVTWYELLTETLPTPEEFASKNILPIPKQARAYRTITRLTEFFPDKRPSLEEVISEIK